MAKVLRGGKWGNVSRGSSRPHAPSEKPPAPSTPVLGEGDERDDDTGTIVCFIEEKREVGVACYDLSANEVHISKFSTEGDYANTALVISQVEACVIVLPKSYASNKTLLRAIGGAVQREAAKSNIFEPTGAAEDIDKEGRQNADEDSKPNSQSGRSKEASQTVEPQDVKDELKDAAERLVSYLANNEFSLSKSADLCQFVSIGGMPPRAYGKARLAYLSHILGEDECILRAVGGLLSFILQNGILGSLGEDNECIQINSISYRNYCKVMKVDPTSLRALHVFKQDSHPVGRGSMQAKEGLSLYGLLKTHIKTISARALLRIWLTFPSTCIETIKDRQFIVEMLRKSSNSAILLAIKEALRGVRNVPAILVRFIRKRASGASDWKALYSSLKSLIVLQDTLKVASQQNEDLLQSPLLGAASNVSEEDLRECLNWIDAVVDFEESTAAGRMVVAHGFSDKIDEMKRCYSGLDDYLTAVGVQEHKRLAEQDGVPPIPSFHFTYQPQVGYLAVIPEHDCERIGLETLQGLGMSFVFSSPEDGYHFKNSRCRELDDELGDIHGAILDLEEKAFRCLIEKICSFSNTLFSISSLAREMDCLQGLASSAIEYSWTKPTFSETGDGLFIEEGRHPIVEFVVASFVPNSSHLKFGDVQVITGPNFSGKSVYLSQVALLVILAQIGSFVPAKKMTTSIFETLNTRISSFESVSWGQSSFFMDACQMSRMLAPCKGRSLNLIDEFGKGTSEEDGMALLAAALRNFLEAPQDKAPICVCSTHFYEVLREPFISLSNPRLGVFSMEVMNRPANDGGRLASNPVRKQLSVNRGTASVGSRVSRLRSQLRANNQEEQGTSIAGDTDASSASVRTYRLLQGSICHESRALQCALEVGVPKVILQRAAHVRQVISGTGYIEDAIPSEDNNQRIHICSTNCRELLLSNYEDELKK